MSKTYSYLRVSTNKQETENQKFGVITLALAKGLTVDEWIIDVISGASDEDDRKLWVAVRKMNPGDTLLMSEVSRIGRDSLDAMGIVNYCNKNGIIVHLAKEGYTLENTIDNKIKTFFYAISAEVERVRISQRTKETLARKRAAGVILGRRKGSKAGTLRIDGSGIIESKLDKYKSKIVKLINEGKSNSEIAREIQHNRPTLIHYIKQNNLRAA